MFRKRSFFRLTNLPQTLFLVAGAVLAYKPVMWLTTTWQDPSYDSKGFYIFLACLGLFLWSISSEKVSHKPLNTVFPLCLLLVSALVRLAGQVLAINMVGALMLVIDVYALSRLAGVKQRRRAISPFWLCVCFAFSLPLERLIQRTIGYGLQHLSADGACVALKGIYENVTCEGVRLFIDHQDVLVDLPCSGARSLLLLMFLFAFCAAVARFKIHHAIAGFALVAVTAFLVNVARITNLAVGISHPETFGGIDVMAQPWHDLIGLMALAFGSLPIIYWTNRFYQPVERTHPVLDKACWCVPRSLQQDGWWLVSKKGSGFIRRSLLSISFLIAALFIVGLQGKPVDVAKPVAAQSLPLQIAGYHKVQMPLSDQEDIYFRQYGGGVEKALYNNIAVMSVSTTAPLRHLHAPDECLRGLGMKVEYQGLAYEPLPTAIYKATDAENKTYRIAVSFISEDREIMTTNVAEAVWHWLQNPGQQWTAIQRISPWEHDAAEVSAFDEALIAALDLTAPSIQLAQLSDEGEDYYD